MLRYLWNGSRDFDDICHSISLNKHMRYLLRFFIFSAESIPKLKIGKIQWDYRHFEHSRTGNKGVTTVTACYN